MKKGLKCLFLLLTVCCIFGFFLTDDAIANSMKHPYPILTENIFDNQINIQSSSSSWTYMLRGENSIRVNDNNTVTIDARTVAKQSVNTIGVTIYLQRWNVQQGSWSDVAYLGNYTATNNSFVLQILSAYVASGYHYRLRTVHYVNHNGVHDSGVNYSGPVYVQ